MTYAGLFVRCGGQTECMMTLPSSPPRNPSEAKLQRQRIVGKKGAVIRLLNFDNLFHSHGQIIMCGVYRPMGIPISYRKQIGVSKFTLYTAQTDGCSLLATNRTDEHECNGNKHAAAYIQNQYRVFIQSQLHYDDKFLHEPSNLSTRHHFRDPISVITGTIKKVIESHYRFH